MFFIFLLEFLDYQKFLIKKKVASFPNEIIAILKLRLPVFEMPHRQIYFISFLLPQNPIQPNYKAIDFHSIHKYQHKTKQISKDYGLET